MLVPLMLVPLTVSTFGIEEYGKLGLVLSLIGIVILFVDFGHELSFKHQVDNQGSIKEAFSTIVTTKIMMFVLSYLGAALIGVLFLDKSINILYFGLLIWRPLEVLLVPKFYFIYIGEIKKLSYYEFGSRLIWVILLFAVNYLDLTISYYLFGQLVTSLIYICIIWKVFGLKKHYRISSITVPSATQIFAAKLSVGIYGFFLRQLMLARFGLAGAGIFELGEKVMVASKMPMGALLNVSLSNIKKFSKRVVYIVALLLGLYISLLVSLFKQILVLFDAGIQLTTLPYFKMVLMFGLLLFTAHSYLFGYRFLYNRRNNEYMFISLLVSLLSYSFIFFCDPNLLWWLVSYDMVLLFLVSIYSTSLWIRR